MHTNQTVDFVKGKTLKKLFEVIAFTTSNILNFLILECQISNY